MKHLELTDKDDFCRLAIIVKVEADQVLSLRIRAKWVLVDWGDGVWKETKQCKFKESGIVHIHVIGQHIMWLNIDGWEADALSLDRCPFLTRLQCQGNRLKGLNLQDCPALTYIDCSNNQLEYLLIANRKRLKEFKGNNNHLEVIDFSGCIQLKTIDLDENPVFVLVVRHSKKLMLLKLKGTIFNAVEYGSNTGNFPEVFMYDKGMMKIRPL